jgi:Ser-tRNA(Ala) deacylase AlaX
MTKKLYYTDPYKVEFTSKIRSQYKLNKNNAIIFDETYFYPTSGGQEHDTGTVNDEPVIDVIEENSDVVHIVKNIVKLIGREDSILCSSIPGSIYFQNRSKKYWVLKLFQAV